MGYIPNYYRPTFSGKQEDEADSPSLKIRHHTSSLYNSSKKLQAVLKLETQSLYHFLVSNNIQLDEHSLIGGLKGRFQEKENEKMKIDITDNEEELVEDTSKKIADPYEPTHSYIELKDFEKKNKDVGDLVVSLEGLGENILAFPALIENFLSFSMSRILECVPTCKLKLNKKESDETLSISPEYNWSYIGVSSVLVSDPNVFVFFSDAVMLYLFQFLIPKLDERISIKISHEFQTSVIPKINEIFHLDLSLLNGLEDELKGRLGDLDSIGRSTPMESKKEEDNYLARCEKLAETYQVDPKDLSDVPLDMIDSVKQNIIDFRVNILKDLERKKQNSLASLNRSDGFRENMNIPVREDRNSYLSDIEYDRVLQGREKAQKEKAYQMHLGQYKKMEEARVRKYRVFESTIKHEVYVEKIIPSNRQKFMAAFVDGVKDDKNKIDGSFSYYTKHSNYLKHRLPAKEKEQIRDKEESS